MFIYLSVQDGGGAACSGLGTARCAQQAAPAPAGGVTAPAHVPPAPVVGGKRPMILSLDLIFTTAISTLGKQTHLQKLIFKFPTRRCFGRVCDTPPIRHMEVSLSQVLHKLFSGTPAHLPIHQARPFQIYTDSILTVSPQWPVFGHEQRSALRSIRFVV